MAEYRWKEWPEDCPWRPIPKPRGFPSKTDGPAVPEGREPASVTEKPTDVELLELMPQQFRDDLATVSRLAAHGTRPDVTPGIFRVSLNTGALEYARAVLARWETPNLAQVRSSLGEGPAVPEGREPASVAPEARPPSPVAQAVLDAVTAELDWDARYHSHSAAAAALRAAADHVAPGEDECMRQAIPDAFDRQQAIRSAILAIAAELEGLRG